MEPNDIQKIVEGLDLSGNKRLESLKKKIMKKMSVKSSSDLTTLMDLCYWLYILGYTEQLVKLHPTINSIKYSGNWDIWTPVEAIHALIYFVSGNNDNLSAQNSLNYIRQAKTDTDNIIKRCNGILLKEYEEKVRIYTDLGKKTDLRNWLCHEMEELMIIYALGGSEKYPLEQIEKRVSEIKDQLKGM